MPRMPASLCCSEYPEHMKAKADEKNARALQRQRAVHALASSPASGTAVRLFGSNESLLAKLWHAVLCSPSGELAPIHLDPDLSRARWPRCADARAGTPGFDDHYVELWAARYNEYKRREAELRGERGEGTLIDEDDPYWEQYKELIGEYRALLFQQHTEWEVLMNPQELYAEVAAIYEVCYKAAQSHQRQQRRSMADGIMVEGAAASAASAASSSLAAAANMSPPRLPGTSCIRFPWRIASQQLIEMKEKARRLAQAESLR